MRRRREIRIRTINIGIGIVIIKKSHELHSGKDIICQSCRQSTLQSTWASAHRRENAFDVGLQSMTGITETSKYTKQVHVT